MTGIAALSTTSAHDAIDALVADGATGAADLAEFVNALEAPRSVWIMVPAAFVDDTIGRLQPLLAAGDTIIDGGNSHYHDDIRRANELAEHGINYLDVGTSGGVFGLERGYCLMIGGADEPVARLRPIFESLAPASTPRPALLAARASPARRSKGGCTAGPPARDTS